MFERSLIVAVAACVLIAGAARADELQAQVLAAARATRSDAFAFRRTIAIERTGGPRKVIVEQFDPRRPVAQQWSLVTVDGHAPEPNDLDRARKAKRGPVPSYGELAEWFGAPATRSDGEPGTVLYRFARLPAGTIRIGSHDASPDMQAEALVNVRGRVPFVERVRMVSTKSFRMILVASVKSMAVTARYRLLADGRPVPADFTSTIAGSMMGKTGELRSAGSYADFQAVR